MEVLFIVILVILIINNKKSSKLSNKIDVLAKNIDDLKYHVTNKKQYQGTTIKEEIKEPKVTIEPEPIITPEPVIITPEPIKEEPVVIQHEKVKPVIKEKSKKEVVVDFTKETKTKKEEKHIEKRQSFSEKMTAKFTRFKKDNPDIETFIGENLISKIGIFILVLGISFFVKYAIDQEWINEVGRVGIGFLSGAILLGFAHKLQKNYKAFSSVLVSGAIVVFYFIIAYAFKEYKLFNQTTAFILMVLVTIFSVAISILYNRKELGVLSLIGGFLVPVLVSTGSGNFVVLFTYLLILNVGFLVLSIKKKWFIINILTFIFTHLFFISWIISDPNIKINASTLFLFATLFYFVFYAMNIFRVIIEKEYAMKPIVMSLFLISTFLYFGQGLYLLDYFGTSFKGVFTLALALINLVTGWLLLQKNIIDKKTVYLFVGMTLTFLTLVGPIQLEGNYITLFWAAESVLLIWLSQKIKSNDFKIVAFIASFLMLGSLAMDFIQIYESAENLKIIFNKGFLTGIFCVASLGITAFLLFKEKTSYKLKGILIEFNPKKVAILAIIVGIVVLYLTGLLELTHQTTNYLDRYLSTIIIAIYNYIFIIIGVFYALNKEKDILHIVGYFVSGIAIVYGLFLLTFLPNSAYISSKLDTTANPTFYIQFIFLILVIAIMRILYAHISKQESKDKKYMLLKYFIAITFVILVSIELLIIAQPITVNPKLLGLENVETTIYGIIYQSKITIIKSGFPILWGILSFIFLYLGIKKSKKEWRIFSLFLVAVTIIKLFVYDIGNVSQGGKIVAFIILGIVLLVISFMYQKIKKAFFKDEEDNKE